MMLFTKQRNILKTVIKNRSFFNISILKSDENLKEINILSNDIQSMSKTMKQNEQQLIEQLDNDPTNFELKNNLFIFWNQIVRCATATSLRRVLANEIQDYLKNKQQIETTKYNLLNQFTSKGFLLLENSRNPVMQLVKRFGSIQVEILFRAQQIQYLIQCYKQKSFYNKQISERHHILKPDEQRNLYYNELDQTKDVLDIQFENQYYNSLHAEREKIARDMILSQNNPLGNPLEEYYFTFLVSVKKQSDVEEYMVYQCQEAYGEITIQNVGLFDNQSEIENILKLQQLKLIPKFEKLKGDKLYQPNFINLSDIKYQKYIIQQRLQQAFLEYLNTFDIDVDLVHSMHRASIFKQQNLFVEWLFNTHQITVDQE